MLETAMRLMQSGLSPSVSDVAEAAQVSRATAYRYFPSQAAMVQAVVNEALGPILGFVSEATEPRERVQDLIAYGYPRMLDFEATHRAALLLALDQWERRQAGTFGTEARIVRGNRRGLLLQALAPLASHADRKTVEKVAQALSLIFGVEAIIVFKDIWGLDNERAKEVALWTAGAIVRAAIAEVSSARSMRLVGTRVSREAGKSKRKKKSANGTGRRPRGRWQ